MYPFESLPKSLQKLQRALSLPGKTELVGTDWNLKQEVVDLIRAFVKNSENSTTLQLLEISERISKISDQEQAGTNNGVTHSPNFQNPTEKPFSNDSTNLPTTTHLSVGSILAVTKLSARLSGISKKSQPTALSAEYTKSQEFSILVTAVRFLFQHILEQNQKLREILTDDKVRVVLTGMLVERQITSSIRQFCLEERITPQEIQEYIQLLKLRLQLRLKHSSLDHERSERLMRLHNKYVSMIVSKYEYGYVNHFLRFISAIVEYPESGKCVCHSDGVFDLLLRAMAKQQIERVRDHLSALCHHWPQLQSAIFKLAETVICPINSDSGESANPAEILDIDKFLSVEPGILFGNSYNLEDWQIVKMFVVSHGIMPADLVAQVEDTIIQALSKQIFHEHVARSSDNTECIKKMGQIGNPRLLPQILKLFRYAPGRYDDDFAFAITIRLTVKRLCRESDPLELTQVLEALPSVQQALLTILADPDSYINRLCPCMSWYAHIQNMELTIFKEHLTKILEQKGRFESPYQLERFYKFAGLDDPEVVQIMLEYRSEVIELIIGSKLKFLNDSIGKFLAVLADPHNEEGRAFIMQIARKGLGLSEKAVANLEAMLNKKPFNKGKHARQELLEGLILLNSKTNGLSVLETLLEMRKSKDDPSRIQRILRYLLSLDEFGAYDTAEPVGSNEPTSDGYDQSLDFSEISSQPPIGGRAVTGNTVGNNTQLELILQRSTSLIDIERRIRELFVQVGCRRLELPDEYYNMIQDRQQELLGGNMLLKIILKLASNYEAKNLSSAKELLRQVLMRFVDGSFQSWRYTHKMSERQLAGLTQAQRELWQSMVEPVSFSVNLSGSERDRHNRVLQEVRNLVTRIQGYVCQKKPDFSVSEQRVQQLEIELRQLEETHKINATSDNGQSLIHKEQILGVELDLIRELLDIQRADPTLCEQNTIISRFKIIIQALKKLQIAPYDLDVTYLDRIFVGDNSQTLKAFDSDNLTLLLELGVNPVQTCLSWKDGLYNHCLLSFVVDSNIKAIVVVNPENNHEIVARTVIRLVRIPTESESKPAILLEKIYSRYTDASIYQAIFSVLLQKAQQINADIVVGDWFGMQRNNWRILEILKQTALDRGYSSSPKTSLTLCLPPSLNRYYYSDTLGLMEVSAEADGTEDIIRGAEIFVAPKS